VETGFDPAHRSYVFHLAFFAGGDNQALLALVQRNFGLECRSLPVFGVAGLYVDKSSQAVVLAEIAAGVLVARGAIANALHRFGTDERGLVAVIEQAHGLDS